MSDANYTVVITMQVLKADGTVHTEAVNKNYVMDWPSVVLAEGSLLEMLRTWNAAAQAQAGIKAGT